MIPKGSSEERKDSKKCTTHFQPFPKQLLLDSWLQGGKHSHQSQLQLSQAGAQSVDH
jgi:hypothetical protein